MMAGLIILKILKILGIVLLCILALIVALILIVLFVPIHYRMEAGYRDKLANARVSVRYLFPVAEVYFSLRQSRQAQETETTLLGGVRILGRRIINFFPDEEEKKKIAEKKKIKEAKKAKKAKHKQRGDEAQPQTKGRPWELHSGAEAALPEINADERIFITQTPCDDTDDVLKDDDPAEEDVGLLEKFRLFFLKLGDILADVSDKILRALAFLTELPDDVNQRLDAIKGKLGGIRKKVRYALKIWDKPQTKSAIPKAKDAILKILKAIRPRKGYLRARLGFEDVATTGQIAGYYGMAYGMFYPLVGKYITVEPDFEQNIMEGELQMKGHIRVCTFLKALWLYLFDKDIKYLKKALKKGGFV